MSKRAILLDLDGTLVDTTHLYREAYAAALGEWGITLTPEQFAELYSSGLYLSEWLAHLGGNPENEKVIRARRDDLYVAALEKRSAWCDGAEVFLTTIAAKGPTGIVTGSWRRYVDAIDTRLRLRDRVDTIIDADDTHPHHKPEPEGLLRAAHELDVDPAHCIYIGDQPFDLEAAKRAGMQSILIVGPHTPPLLAATSPCVCLSLNEILTQL